MCGCNQGRYGFGSYGGYGRRGYYYVGSGSDDFSGNGYGYYYSGNYGNGGYGLGRNSGYAGIRSNPYSYAYA